MEEGGTVEDVEGICVYRDVSKGCVYQDLRGKDDEERPGQLDGLIRI
ncbi:hypothetical protein [Syntrophaceticus schinkii]|nr:hypothetical protein [Syntrophaceticus schinkii]